MTEKKSSFYRNVGIGIGIGVVAIIVVAALYVVFTTPTSSPAPTKPEYVMVSGIATNMDPLSYADDSQLLPLKIVFTSMRDGNTYSARFNVVIGYYAISLPNLDSYNVTINWKFNSIYAGDSYAGTFNLNTTETSLTKDWASPYQYPLKPEYVMVSGIASGIYTPSSFVDLKPVKIVFTSMRDGNTYETRFNGTHSTYLSNNDYNVTGYYAISLPNLDSYNVTITWRINIIFSGPENAGTLNLYTNETAITKNWYGYAI